jgi:hypothetical protein
MFPDDSEDCVLLFILPILMVNIVSNLLSMNN